jgi:thioredoxin reductase (NADPH)
MARSNSGDYAVVWPRSAKAVEVKPLSRRLDTLDGKTIAFLWDDLFRGDEIWPILKQELGGDAALSEAIHLGQFARTVTIVTRGEMFRARRHYVSRIADDERFRLRWASEIVEVLGGDGVEGVRVRDREARGDEVIACSGLFVFVGLVPNAGLLGAEVARDAQGFVVTNAGFETAASGVFAVGAVRSGYGGRLTQAVAEATSAAEGASAR